MNRLTRCPACTTIFRVTDEQLDSRQGFVRCGQCAKVFDARASLTEERGPEGASGAAAEPLTRLAPPTAAHVPPSAEAGRGEADAGDAAAESTNAPSEPAREEADPFEGMDVEEIVLSLDAPGPEQAAPDAQEGDGGPAADAAGMYATPGHAPEPTPDAAPDPRRDGTVVPSPDSAPDVTTAPASAPVTAAAAPILRPVATADDDEPLPFGPKHRARSRTAAVMWGIGALILLVLLAGQSAYWFRTELATAVPETRPYLERACRELKCTVPAARQTALLSIESSELQVDKNVPGLLTLNATLRNRAAFPQVHPSIELTLTDADDRPLSRRVLAPADYLGDRLAKEPLFPAVSEHVVRLHIDATAFRPTGYRLFLFHP